MNLRCLMCAGVTSAAIVAACGGSMESVSTTTTTSAPVMARKTVLAAPIRVSAAVDQVTAARCARELDCQNIGYERAWPSYDACTRDVGAVMRTALYGSGCANGVDPLALDDCIDATRTQTCVPPTSVRGRITAGCDASALCL